MRMEKKYIVRRRIMKLVGIVLMLIGAAVCFCVREQQRPPLHSLYTKS